MNVIEDMQLLINKLNYHTELYDKGTPSISDTEWDKIYFELQDLEKRFNLILPGSPTNKIHFVKVSELKKVKHNHPMLSLDKTKDVNEVKSFLKGKDSIAMSKMDGLTCSLKYINGELVSAETRGDGVEGEDITHNAAVVASIPNSIDYNDELVIDGEIICSYDDFKEFEDRYENPRNFAAGSIRLLDSKECSTRKLKFVAWDCIKGLKENTLHGKLQVLRGLGFLVVPYLFYSGEIEDIKEQIERLQAINEILYYPIDGIVFKYDNCDEYESCGRTEHHFRGGLAFKFADEIVESYLKDIEWSMGRTGVLTPVAIVEPVVLEGTTVERCSLHNISIRDSILGTCPYIGQPVKVMKMNKIIPQLTPFEEYKNSDPEYPEVDFIQYVPTFCPVCYESTSIHDNNGIKTLHCENPNCGGKTQKKIDHYCSKKGLDIKGLSEKTIEKLMDWGWLNNITDLYTLSEHKDEWSKKDGFGAKSVAKILNAIEESTENVELVDFIAALGIPLIGKAVAKELVKYIDDWDDFILKVEEHYDFSSIDGFGEEMCSSLWNFNYGNACYIANNFITFATKEKENEVSQTLENITVVITGKLTNFKNRDELKAKIEAAGGKVASAVSSKTNYLINNDINSTSSKNVKAKSLGVEIITEGDFISKFF